MKQKTETKVVVELDFAEAIQRVCNCFFPNEVPDGFVRPGLMFEHIGTDRTAITWDNSTRLSYANIQGVLHTNNDLDLSNKMFVEMLLGEDAPPDNVIVEWDTTDTGVVLSWEKVETPTA